MNISAPTVSVDDELYACPTFSQQEAAQQRVVENVLTKKEYFIENAEGTERFTPAERYEKILADAIRSVRVTTPVLTELNPLIVQSNTGIHLDTVSYVRRSTVSEPDVMINRDSQPNQKVVTFQNVGAPVLKFESGFRMGEMMLASDGVEKMYEQIVAEMLSSFHRKLENSLLYGLPSAKNLSGHESFGLLNHTDRNTYTLESSGWNDSVTGVQVLNDVAKMIGVLGEKGFESNLVMFVSGKMNGRLTNEFSTNYRGTIKAQILETYPQIERIVSSYTFPDNVLLLMEKTRNTCEINEVQGFTINFSHSKDLANYYIAQLRVALILKADMNKNLGVLHASA